MRNIIDLDRDETSTVFIAGMGRSGTTWVSNIVNYDQGYRDIFEPFLPAEVPEARAFGYHEYRRAGDNVPEKEEVARRILAGRVRCAWTDKFNPRRFAQRRIVKDIRCNLMLGWLRRLRPGMPMILVLRHPLGIIRSWAKLGWGTSIGGGTDVDHILAQQHLLEDFPKIEELSRTIDPTNTFESTAFVWCVLHMVPLAQLDESKALMVRYEDLLGDPAPSVVKMFERIGRPYDQQKVARAMRLGSGTNFLKRDVATLSVDAIAQEMSMFPAQQVDKLRQLVHIAGLESLYGDEWFPAAKSLSAVKEEAHADSRSDTLISVVICTRNRADRLHRCFDALSKLQSCTAWELVLVDNGSTDNTAEIIEQFRNDATFPVRSIFEPRPGLGRARNTGWRAASGNIIAFTDDDCYPAPDYLSMIGECFNDTNVAFLGGRILLYDQADYPITIRATESRFDIEPHSFVRTGLVQGANCAFRRDALEAVGGFDDEMGAGTAFLCEDVEILARLTFAGFPGVYDPRPLVYHHHGRRSDAGLALRKGYDKGRGAYYAKCLLDRQMRPSYLKNWYWSVKQRRYRKTLREMLGAMNYFSWRLRFRPR